MKTSARQNPPAHTGRALLHLDAIRATASHLGSHFFDRDTMRFFRSRVSPPVLVLPDGSALFITSEQFRDHRGYVETRKYTVRHAWVGCQAGQAEPSFNVDEDEAGFQGYDTLSRARTAAKHWLGRELAAFATQNPRVSVASR